MTLPTCYSWSPVGKSLNVAYEAPQGRRLNALGGYISHGPDAGTFETKVYASLPKPTSKKRRKSAAEVAASYGLCEEEVGPIDSERFVDFLWQVAGRPLVHASDWKRSRPLYIVLDNYSVHKGDAVKAAQEALEAADIRLWYLPSYSPELSAIEPVWNALKHHEMQVRSHTDIKTMKLYVEREFARKAETLKAEHIKTTNILRAAA